MRERTLRGYYEVTQGKQGKLRKGAALSQAKGSLGRTVGSGARAHPTRLLSALTSGTSNGVLVHKLAVIIRCYASQPLSMGRLGSSALRAVPL